jgi:hypothetical protein
MPSSQQANPPCPSWGVVPNAGYTFDRSNPPFARRTGPRVSAYRMRARRVTLRSTQMSAGATNRRGSESK